jgi:23S rRNA (guanine2445-N2)-methyltransferase / 23S rRNA (guanine2069-N7)-methyltransferase
MASDLSFFATTAKGMEPLLAAELASFEAGDVCEQRAGAAFSGPLEVAYRACLWSRVASRVLLPLATFPAATPETLYEGVRGIDWRQHLDSATTLAVDCTTARSRLSHSHFAALKSKDAIVDQLRDKLGARPSIDTAEPGVRVNVRIGDDRVTVSLDLSGSSLHRRAYRASGAAAPLKETLAAAVLMLADWPRLARQRAPLVDPMCGSGTLLIEAALIAADIAPGAARTYFGFLGWRRHDAPLWQRLRAEAEERRIRDTRRLADIRGYDLQASAVRAALENCERAGLRGALHVERRALADCAPLADSPPGVLVTNPPYGARLGDTAGLGELYATLGDVLRRRFLGWTGYVLSGNRELAGRIGLRATRRHVLYNGAIECRLLVYPIASEAAARPPRWRRDHD